MNNLQYPLGKFQARRSPLFPVDRVDMIGFIAGCPRQMRAAVANLNERQLDTPYRDGGWTVRQVVHHVPDSHLNAYVRLKLALTEDEPTIKPYDEARWAETADTRSVPIEVSLTLLESLHTRWVAVLNSLSNDDFARKFRHPDFGLVDVDWLLQMYAWHSRHHVAHITSLRERNGW
jgi:hypothetical protein